MSYAGLTKLAVFAAIASSLVLLPSAEAASRHRPQQASNQEECTMINRLEPGREGRDIHVMDLDCLSKAAPSQDDCSFVTTSRIDPDGVQVIVSDLTCPRKNRAAPLNKNGIATLK